MLVVVASPAVAQENQSGLKLPLVVYASTAALDYHSTHHFLQFKGLQEWNPAINWLDHRPKTMIVVGSAMEVAAAYALYRWIGKSHPKVYRVTLYALSGVHVGGAWRNYAGTRQLERIGPDDRAKWARYRRCGYAC